MIRFQIHIKILIVVVLTLVIGDWMIDNERRLKRIEKQNEQILARLR